MTEPVGSWVGDLVEIATIRRESLGPVAAFSDSEIDKLYAQLVALEEAEGGNKSPRALQLVEEIRVAEEQRAAEMGAYFSRTGMSLDPEAVRQLLAKVDKAFGD